MRNLHRQRRRIQHLMPVETGQRASGHIAHYIAARALRRKPNLRQRIHDLRQRLDGQPVQLNILPRRNVGDAACVLRSNVCDDMQLVRGQQPVRQPDAHHEVLAGFALAAAATGHAQPIALRVDAPPLEVGSGPLRQNAGASRARELPHLIPGVPGVLRELQAFSTKQEAHEG